MGISLGVLGRMRSKRRHSRRHVTTKAGYGGRIHGRRRSSRAFRRRSGRSLQAAWKAGSGGKEEGKGARARRRCSQSWTDWPGEPREEGQRRGWEEGLARRRDWAEG